MGTVTGGEDGGRAFGSCPAGLSGGRKDSPPGYQGIYRSGREGRNFAVKEPQAGFGIRQTVVIKNNKNRGGAWSVSVYLYLYDYRRGGAHLQHDAAFGKEEDDGG